MTFFRQLSLAALIIVSSALNAQLPELTPRKVSRKAEEIMRAHVSQKTLSDELIQRILSRYVDELDPSKTYLVKPEIQGWLEPDEKMIETIRRSYKNSDFSEFISIHARMVGAIERRNQLQNLIVDTDLPEDVDPKEFKDMEWADSADDLLVRLMRLRSLQIEGSERLPEEKRELALNRIEKRRLKYEEDVLEPNDTERKRYIYATILKATASALDAHTAYLTPEEATQFMINVQQRLYGIGAQLRDDLNGFTLVKIIEGGPAHRSKKLKAKDRIIAVDGEPAVGMDTLEVVELIRGEEDTDVVLTIVRTTGTGDAKKTETFDVEITRGEVILSETRIESDYEPFGDGVIGYVKLFSFYQDSDPGSSSAEDVRKAIRKLKAEHKLKGLVLDLRFNSGGLLPQAVAVTGLFITKGVVVSIKDSQGNVQPLRDVDSSFEWDGPLFVLVNKASASASEIVTQTLQDYGRAIVVGDETSFGKGSYQTFTLRNSRGGGVNPEGEYKVTRGRYYTVSGASPQLIGVRSDIVVPGVLSEAEVGEQFSTYPLQSAEIAPMFHDTLLDIPPAKRESIARLYQFNLQAKLSTYEPYLDRLKENSAKRMSANKNYQQFLKALKDEEEEEEEEEATFGQNDLQLEETYSIMKDLILLLKLAPQQSVAG
jgi:carboxyl-terminal processing protease